MSFSFILRRTILFLWHFIIILYSYVQLFIQQIRILFSNRIDLQKRVNNLVKIPENIAIVIDNYSQHSDHNIIKTVDFISQIPQINYLAVFFNQETAPLSFSSKKVQVLTAKENNDVFLSVMESSKPLSDCCLPFPKPLELAIIFSKYPKLCNFFTWNLDLTTLYFAGPSIDISPVAILDALNDYAKTEQRCGK